MFERLKPRRGSAGLYLLLLGASVGAMIALRQCSTPTLGPRAEVVAGGDTLNVAIEVSPMGVTLGGDSLTGVYYDKIKEMCRRHGRPVHMVPFTQLDDALRGLDEGRYQLVASDIPATAEMKERYIFVDAVGTDRQVLVQRRDSTGGVGVATQFDLAGCEVWLPKGSPFLSRIRALSREIGDTIVVREDPDYSSEQLVILAATGELTGAGVVVSEGVAKAMLDHYPQLDASVEISLRQFHSWAMAPKDSLLRDTISAWLRK